MTAQNMETWSIDPGHSAVQFKVKHLAIANVNGSFDVCKGTVYKPTDKEDFEGAEINLEIEAGSINTKNEKRDEHLRSDAFFDVQQFPAITFKGRLQKASKDYLLVGDLSIRDKVQQVVLEVDFHGIGQGRFNDTRAGFEVNGSINRKDFGLVWNMLTETGNLIVGEEIKLHMDIELIKG